MKWIVFVSLMLTTVACQQIMPSSYSGDGELTKLLGCVDPPLYQIQMLPVDLSKPQSQRYALTGIPPSERMYRVALIVSSAEILSGRHAWGECVFKLKNHGKVIQTVRSKFSELNDQFRTRNQVYAGGLSSPAVEFHVRSGHDQWELTFERSGFDSPEPIWCHILICSEGH